MAYLEVLQPCPTYNDPHTREWFAGKGMGHGQSRIYVLEQEGYDSVIPGDADQELAFAKMPQCITKAYEWGDRIPIGVFLENRSMPTFEERLALRLPSYQTISPARRSIADAHGRPTTDLSPLFAEVTV